MFYFILKSSRSIVGVMLRTVLLHITPFKYLHKTGFPRHLPARNQATWVGTPGQVPSTYQYPAAAAEKNLEQHLIKSYDSSSQILMSFSKNWCDMHFLLASLQIQLTGKRLSNKACKNLQTRPKIICTDFLFLWKNWKKAFRVSILIILYSRFWNHGISCMEDLCTHLAKIFPN